MKYDILLDLVTDIGYELAMCGAETFRVEETIRRITASYHVHSEAFAIPNCLIVSVITDTGTPITRLRRIGYHGNNLDTVEKLNELSRKICSTLPDPDDAMDWLDEVMKNQRSFPLPTYIFGSFLGAAGFSLLFGCGGLDIILSGICGILAALCTKLMDRMKANQFFNSLISSFAMALLALCLTNLGIASNPDSIIIGALMLLVPGLLFTNAMRDVIYGDTNSGVNRIVQVLLIAAALALGTAAAWGLVTKLWALPQTTPPAVHSFALLLVSSAVACIGFSILNNIHGPGMLLCALGGMLTWAVFELTVHFGGTEMTGYFLGAAFGSLYAEIMARIRKYPAISYLVVSIFPLIPGAGVYYTMTHAIRGDMNAFAVQGMYTAGIAGAMAAGILLVSTCVRLYYTAKQLKVSRK